MPNPPTANMGLILATDQGDSGIWGAEVNAALTLIDQHTHAAGLGIQVPTAGLNINADLIANGHALYNALAFDFLPSSATLMTSFAGALFCNSADNELYWRTTGGANVKLTAGAALNVAAFVGGIGGDYTAVSALESYDDATRRYLFQQEGAPRPWAGIATGDIDLYQKAASITNKVTLQSPAALAASYVVQFPAALPAATSYLYMSASGLIGNTPINQTLIVPASAADLNSNTRTQLAGSSGENAITLSGGVNNYCAFPIPLKAGDTIVSISVYINKVTANTTTIGASWVETTMANGTAFVASSTNAGAAPGYTTIAINGINHLIGAGVMEHVGVAVTVGAGTTDTVLGIAVLYTPGM